MSFMTPFYRNGFFGAYPTPEDLRALEERGFDWVISLTVPNEKNIDPYTVAIPMVTFPIKDNNAPQDWDRFSAFIAWLAHTLRDDQYVFVHCKGGHGRSCIVITCVLYYIYAFMNARDAIEHTIQIHNQRTNMSLRWKAIKSPFSKSQYIFLYKFLNPICILKSYNTGYQAGFSGSSLFEIETEIGVFSNLDAAYQAVRAHHNPQSPYETMLSLTRLKFTRYEELQNNLLNTGIRKIYDLSRYAFGDNLIGQCLMELRDEYLRERWSGKRSTPNRTISEHDEEDVEFTTVMV